MNERINQELVSFGRAFIVGSRIGAVAGVLIYAGARLGRQIWRKGND